MGWTLVVGGAIALAACGATVHAHGMFDLARFMARNLPDADKRACLTEHVAPNCVLLHYERHRPEQTTLYRMVQQHAASFIACAEPTHRQQRPQDGSG